MKVDKEAFLGGQVDDDGTPSTEEATIYELDRFTTHGVIVGMTGSGKTGLGIDLIEETLLSGIPSLVIDPKGDMGNLLLTFPDLSPTDFRPWIDEGEAERDGITPDELAASTAQTWKEGLASWDIEPERLQRIVDNTDLTIYTPGSSAGVPLNVLGSLAAPELSWDTDAETMRDEIEGFVSSLLVLAGIEADAVSDPRHILLATLIERSWKEGSDLDLAKLVGQIPKPPIRKLGVFELNSFFPEDDRMKLAMTLNGLLASPSFSVWLEGEALDIGKMIAGGDKTKSAIVYLAHLSDTERQFLVTLLLSKMVTWIRQQSGTSQLQALIYMDEVFGFAPPTAEPPSKKPILTILKQARAHGVGMVLATQNPVDLDYKAMSNAGTWMIGRLQTERDKLRILEGLESASGTVKAKDVDPVITSLTGRQFLLHSTKSEPAVFTTRWAMSYLAGPLTRDEVAKLSGDVPAAVDETLAEAPSTVAETPTVTPETATPAAEPPANETPVTETTVTETPVTEIEPPTDGDTVPVAPPVADGIGVVYLDPAAPWVSKVGSAPDGGRYRAGLVATINLRFDERSADIDHPEIYEAVLTAPADPLTSETVIAVDHDERDFVAAPADGAKWELTDANLDSKTWWRETSSDLKDHLVRTHSLQVFQNEELDVVSRPGETRQDFETRCGEVAGHRADEELAELKEKYADDADRVKDQIASADRRVQELATDVESRRGQELLSGAVDLFGSLFGGRSKSAALRRAASKRSMTRRTAERQETALAKLTAKERDLVELEDELEREILEITSVWDEKATETGELEIGLERDDVDVSQLRLLWYPV
ncbi:MAG: hypothetical protein GEU79_16925 [Acidimicrobiia bacterium]|nr:hypothetical protein [Acidimicrobiia bacterium]